MFSAMGGTSRNGKDPPKEWEKVGFIRVHPEDTDIHTKYSPVVLTENPKTWIPTKEDDEDYPMEPWGLSDPPTDDPIADMMMRVVGGSSNLYGSYNNPTMQFIKQLEKRKIALVDSETVTAACEHTTLVIKISLYGCAYNVWRRVRLPAGIKLSTLHDQVLGPVMGWSRGYHGYVFLDSKDGSVFGPKKGGYIDMMHAEMQYHYFMDDNEIPLATLVCNVGDSCDYVYDLGDGWHHKIEVEEVTEDSSSVVVLLNGAGACPPEDSNGLENKGSQAYAEFLAVYKRSPKKSSVKQAIREIENTAGNYVRPWMGHRIEFKPNEFDLERHRLMMYAMLQGPSVQNRGMMHGGRGDQFKESMRGCANCGDRIKALQRCSRCRKTWYCSRDCQAVHWKAGHKKECKLHDGNTGK